MSLSGSQGEIARHQQHVGLKASRRAAVVLLHGFPETNYAWRYQIPMLARHDRVIAPDLRGYGETEKPASGHDKRVTPPYY
jgi:haloacetate dehalogenase